HLLEIRATVVMPLFAPLTRVVYCRRFGAKIILQGANIEEARAYGETLHHSQGLTYINGCDDPPIIAGQGTLGLELAEQVPDLDAVVVPIGGAGLIGGLALALKQ